MKGQPVHVRFWSKVSGTDALGCWVWTSTKTRDGYGYFWHGAGSIEAHRFAYELLVHEIPAGLEIDHLCRVRDCVNPWHLEPVTHAENVRRSWAARPRGLSSIRTRSGASVECVRGHLASKVGIYVRPRDGSQMCRECRREDMRRFYQRRQAAA